MPSGGGGMVSTAEDYLRFAQMLLKRRGLDDVRILAPATVQLMTSNHIASSLMTGEDSLNPRPGLGWGYDCAVFTDPAQADRGGWQRAPSSGWERRTRGSGLIPRTM